MAIPVQIVIDCSDPEQLATFWAATLHYQAAEPPSGFASWEAFLEAQHIPQTEWNSAYAIVDPEKKGPRIYFQRVPEPKTLKNRVHIDVNVSSEDPQTEARTLVEAAVRRITALGAHELYRGDQWNGYWVTMADPEGNEFCIQ